VRAREQRFFSFFFWRDGGVLCCEENKLVGIISLLIIPLVTDIQIFRISEYTVGEKAFVRVEIFETKKLFFFFNSPVGPLVYF
jgi:hypothetical protein